MELKFHDRGGSELKFQVWLVRNGFYGVFGRELRADVWIRLRVKYMYQVYDARKPLAIQL